MESADTHMPNTNANDEEIRTLFLSGLPVDVKERELHNLFRPYENYEGAIIKFNQKLGIPIAFASFTNQASALVAKEKLHGIRFDPESSTELRLELAKSNTRTKRLRDLTDSAGDSSTKRSRHSGYGGGGSGGHGYGGHGYGGFGGQGGYYDPNTAPGAPWGQGYGGYDGGYGAPPPAPYGMYGGGYGAPPAARGRGSDSNNPANSTLFVANLAPNVTEMSLREVFQHVPGCRRVKVLHKPGAAPTAFLEFADAAAATACREAMDGTFAHYTDRNGLRVEYAKRKMGQPGRFTDTSSFANPEGVHPNVVNGGAVGLADLGGDAAASTYATGYTPTPIAPPTSGLM